MRTSLPSGDASNGPEPHSFPSEKMLTLPVAVPPPATNETT
jgi:hypothetical protein